jgi:hypothetical protein
MSGDLEHTIELDIDDPPYLTVASLLLLGRKEDAVGIRAAAHERIDLNNRHLLFLIDGLTSFVEGKRLLGVEAIQRLLGEFPAFSDPEGLYYWSYCLAGLGESETALELLAQSVDKGMSCVRALHLPPFLPLHTDARFIEILTRVTERHNAASRAFEDAGGPRLLGLTP